MEEPIRIEFTSPNNTPEAFVAAFGGKIENGVYYAPETKPEPSYLQLVRLQKDKAVYRHANGVMEELEITPRQYDYLKDKVGQKYIVKPKFNLTTSTIHFEGTVINPDKE